MTIKIIGRLGRLNIVKKKDHPDIPLNPYPITTIAWVKSVGNSSVVGTDD